MKTAKYNNTFENTLEELSRVLQNIYLFLNFTKYANMLYLIIYKPCWTVWRTDWRTGRGTGRGTGEQTGHLPHLRVLVALKVMTLGAPPSWMLVTSRRCPAPSGRGPCLLLPSGVTAAVTGSLADSVMWVTLPSLDCLSSSRRVTFPPSHSKIAVDSCAVKRPYCW